ncbi:baseplate J/gp47 family protein [Levilinea saccharolytica]|uniref:baseplate J/gp47 family protein n=1 Tax=Levilinea saccharolytica TaxID=229921 RepID=UPI0009E329DD|nr:baseplate J/gp47 family protein [Levilinea saccharolytica]GAP17741.1 baseplate J-like protein [Levilinea saccharolytica]
MKTCVIQLERHDDIISTQDKMAWAKTPRVVLVWPPKGSPLRRPIDLIILARYAQQLGVQVGLVTGDYHTRQHAAQAGIPVFDSAREAQRRPWRRKGRRKISPPAGADSLARREKLSETRPQRRHVNELPSWGRLAAFSVGVLAVAALLILFLPGAEVRLPLAERPQQLTLDLLAHPDIQAPNLSGGVPAQVLTVTVEGQRDALSSGEIWVGDSAARGEVLFTNLTDQTVIVPEGTVVRNLGEPVVRFRTLEERSLPGTGEKSAAVPVAAVQPGAVGNLEAGQITAIEGAVGAHLSVTQVQPTSGGRDRRVPSPSEEDYAALRTELLANLRQTALNELKMQQPDGFWIEESLAVEQTLVEKREPETGSPGDQLRLTLQVEFGAWVVRAADVEQVARTALDANLPPGRTAADGPLGISPVGAVKWDETGARWQAAAVRNERQDLRSLDVSRRLVGLRPEQAADELSAHLDLAGAPEITLRPAWWPWMPFLAGRIEVVSP